MDMPELQAECKKLGFKVLDFGTYRPQFIEIPGKFWVPAVLIGGQADYQKTLEAAKQAHQERMKKDASTNTP